MFFWDQNINEDGLDGTVLNPPLKERYNLTQKNTFLDNSQTYFDQE